MPDGAPSCPRDRDSIRAPRRIGAKSERQSRTGDRHDQFGAAVSVAERLAGTGQQPSCLTGFAAADQHRYAALRTKLLLLGSFLGLSFPGLPFLFGGALARFRCHGIRRRHPHPELPHPPHHIRRRCETARTPPAGARGSSSHPAVRPHPASTYRRAAQAPPEFRVSGPREFRSARSHEDCRACAGRSWDRRRQSGRRR